MSTYVIDLDGTLCQPNLHIEDSEGRYAIATPSLSVIERVRELKSRGHTIIIHTARRMKTHNGDVQKVIEDVGALTEEWLRRHDVPYDQLVFGKPNGDFYVDDKGISIEAFLREQK